jgi:hypothetical protein
MLTNDVTRIISLFVLHLSADISQADVLILGIWDTFKMILIGVWTFFKTKQNTLL